MERSVWRLPVCPLRLRLAEDVANIYEPPNKLRTAYNGTWPRAITRAPPLPRRVHTCLVDDCGIRLIHVQTHAPRGGKARTARAPLAAQRIKGDMAYTLVARNDACPVGTRRSSRTGSSDTAHNAQPRRARNVTPPRQPPSAPNAPVKENTSRNRPQKEKNKTPPTLHHDESHRKDAGNTPSQYPESSARSAR
ncbi:hypothetical protein C8J57DRAFT_1512653 [Mycena rebaudengoi]|nr:hypothetical protein C8J57DRAFT_1512653 [Mycena rebaudengoi]